MTAEEIIDMNLEDEYQSALIELVTMVSHPQKLRHIRNYKPICHSGMI